jgi:hypothetical protein
MLKSEFKNLESFNNYLNKPAVKKSQKDVTGIQYFYLKFTSELRKLQYFQFIPKDSSNISQAKLKLAVDMKSLFNYYHIQSYFVGINCLYFSLIFMKSRRVLGISSIMSIIFASGVTFGFFRYHYSKIFGVMDLFFKDEVKYLYETAKRDKIGFNQKVAQYLLNFFYNFVNINIDAREL